MSNSPDAAAQKMIENLPDKTGRPLDAWMKLLAGTGIEKHGEIVRFLKSEHDVTHGFANLIAHRFRDSRGSGAPDDPVAAQYSGARADLRPIYDKLVEIVQGFGNDVDVSPKKTYVSLRRSKQFALIQPSTKDRVDIGINLKGAKPGKRLEASGSFNAMVSHRVRVSSPQDVDEELENWLRKAYEAA